MICENASFSNFLLTSYLLRFDEIFDDVSILV